MRRFNFIITVLLGCLFLLPMPAQSLAEEKEGAVYRPFKGIYHLHTRFSHDSKAELRDIAHIAREIGAEFVVVTDHNNMDAKDHYPKLQLEEPPLFIFGDEVSVTEGHLVVLGVPEAPPELDTAALIDWVHEKGGYAFLAHPFSPKNPWKSWEVDTWDGFEVFNFADNIRTSDWGDVIDSYFSHDSEKLMENTQRISDRYRDLWHQHEAAKRKFAILAATDAHLKRSTHQFETALKSVAQYVWAEELTPEAVIEALGQGRSYFVFEKEPSAKQFSFIAEKDGEFFYVPGEEVSLEDGMNLHVKLPVSAHIYLLRDGDIILDQESEELSYPLSEPGAYRVEIELEGEPWIYTNSIYVE